MNKIFALCGKPGSGKSYAAKDKNLNNYFFDKETFEYLSELFEDFSEDEEYITFDNMNKLIIDFKDRIKIP